MFRARIVSFLVVLVFDFQPKATGFDSQCKMLPLRTPLGLTSVVLYRMFSQSWLKIK